MVIIAQTANASRASDKSSPEIERHEDEDVYVVAARAFCESSYFAVPNLFQGSRL